MVHGMLCRNSSKCISRSCNQCTAGHVARIHCLSVCIALSLKMMLNLGVIEYYSKLYSPISWMWALHAYFVIGLRVIRVLTTFPPFITRLFTDISVKAECGDNSAQGAPATSPLFANVLSKYLILRELHSFASCRKGPEQTIVANGLQACRSNMNHCF